MLIYLGAAEVIVHLGIVDGIVLYDSFPNILTGVLQRINASVGILNLGVEGDLDPLAGSLQHFGAVRLSQGQNQLALFPGSRIDAVSIIRGYAGLGELRRLAAFFAGLDHDCPRTFAHEFQNRSQLVCDFRHRGILGNVSLDVVGVNFIEGCQIGVHAAVLVGAAGALLVHILLDFRNLRFGRFVGNGLAILGVGGSQVAGQSLLLLHFVLLAFVLLQPRPGGGPGVVLIDRNGQLVCVGAGHILGAQSQLQVGLEDLLGRTDLRLIAFPDLGNGQVFENRLYGHNIGLIAVVRVVIDDVPGVVGHLVIIILVSRQICPFLDLSVEGEGDVAAAQSGLGAVADAVDGGIQLSALVHAFVQLRNLDCFAVLDAIAVCHGSRHRVLRIYHQFQHGNQIVRHINLHGIGGNINHYIIAEYGIPALQVAVRLNLVDKLLNLRLLRFVGNDGLSFVINHRRGINLTLYIDRSFFHQVGDSLQARQSGKAVRSLILVQRQGLTCHIRRSFLALLALQLHRNGDALRPCDGITVRIHPKLFNLQLGGLRLHRDGVGLAFVLPLVIQFNAGLLVNGVRGVIGDTFVAGRCGAAEVSRDIRLVQVSCPVIGLVFRYGFPGLQTFRFQSLDAAICILNLGIEGNLNPLAGLGQNSLGSFGTHGQHQLAGAPGSSINAVGCLCQGFSVNGKQRGAVLTGRLDHHRDTGLCFRKLQSLHQLVRHHQVLGILGDIGQDIIGIHFIEEGQIRMDRVVFHGRLGILLVNILLNGRREGLVGNGEDALIFRIFFYGTDSIAAGIRYRSFGYPVGDTYQTRQVVEGHALLFCRELISLAFHICGDAVLGLGQLHFHGSAFRPLSRLAIQHPCLGHFYLRGFRLHGHFVGLRLCGGAVFYFHSSGSLVDSAFMGLSAFQYQAVVRDGLGVADFGGLNHFVRILGIEGYLQPLAPNTGSSRHRVFFTAKGNGQGVVGNAHGGRRNLRTIRRSNRPIHFMVIRILHNHRANGFSRRGGLHSLGFQILADLGKLQSLYQRIRNGQLGSILGDINQDVILEHLVKLYQVYMYIIINVLFGFHLFIDKLVNPVADFFHLAQRILLGSLAHSSFCHAVGHAFQHRQVGKGIFGLILAQGYGDFILIRILRHFIVLGQLHYHCSVFRPGSIFLAVGVPGFAHLHFGQHRLHRYGVGGVFVLGLIAYFNGVGGFVGNAGMRKRAAGDRSIALIRLAAFVHRFIGNLLPADGRIVSIRIGFTGINLSQFLCQRFVNLILNLSFKVNPDPVTTEGLGISDFHRKLLLFNSRNYLGSRFLIGCQFSALNHGTVFHGEVRSISTQIINLNTILCGHKIQRIIQFIRNDGRIRILGDVSQNVIGKAFVEGFQIRMYVLVHVLGDFRLIFEAVGESTNCCINRLGVCDLIRLFASAGCLRGRCHIFNYIMSFRSRLNHTHFHRDRNHSVIVGNVRQFVFICRNHLGDGIGVLTILRKANLFEAYGTCSLDGYRIQQFGAFLQFKGELALEVCRSALYRFGSRQFQLRRRYILVGQLVGEGEGCSIALLALSTSLQKALNTAYFLTHFVLRVLQLWLFRELRCLAGRTDGNRGNTFNYRSRSTAHLLQKGKLNAGAGRPYILILTVLVLPVLLRFNLHHLRLHRNRVGFVGGFSGIANGYRVSGFICQAGMAAVSVDILAVGYLAVGFARGINGRIVIFHPYPADIGIRSNIAGDNLIGNILVAAFLNSGFKADQHPEAIAGHARILPDLLQIIGFQGKAYGLSIDSNPSDALFVLPLVFLDSGGIEGKVLACAAAVALVGTVIVNRYRRQNLGRIFLYEFQIIQQGVADDNLRCRRRNIAHDRVLKLFIEEFDILMYLLVDVLLSYHLRVGDGVAGAVVGDLLDKAGGHSHFVHGVDDIHAFFRLLIQILPAVFPGGSCFVLFVFRSAKGDGAFNNSLFPGLSGQFYLNRLLIILRGIFPDLGHLSGGKILLFGVLDGTAMSRRGAFRRRIATQLLCLFHLVGDAVQFRKVLVCHRPLAAFIILGNFRFRLSLENLRLGIHLGIALVSHYFEGLLKGSLITISCFIAFPLLGNLQRFRLRLHRNRIGLVAGGTAIS